jgi:hypothetical protein
MNWSQRIRHYYLKIRDKLTTIGILAALVALFTGHIFTAVVIGGLTYFFWKNQDGVDELVGVK